jgi:DNA helicase-4
LNGETVKSKGEKKIADYFHENNIRYEYETSACSKGLLFSREISKPDFYLPDFNVYVEYWGMVNTENGRKRNGYVRNMKWKMAQYYENNIKFISLYPDNLCNLDWIFRAKLREVIGRDLK